MSKTAVGAREVMQAWGRILKGYRPNLSIEITKECPLRCPGCYAYGDEHLAGGVTLRGLSDFKGDELVSRFMDLIDRHKPLHLSIVGGEPLVRFRELNQLLPWLSERGVYTQLVTSAVRPIPQEWIGLPRLQIVVSIDGLQPEHDERRGHHPLRLARAAEIEQPERRATAARCRQDAAAGCQCCCSRRSAATRPACRSATRRRRACVASTRRAASRARWRRR
mgnify:CR=1 FL=1